MIPVKKLVFYGDGLLCPPSGYGEQLVDLCVLRQPGAVFQSFHPGEENLLLETALKGAPFHILGKAPDLVYLGLGNADLLQSSDPHAMISTLDALLQLVLQKTRAQVAFTPAFEAFLPEAGQRERAQVYNAGLPALAGERVFFLDLNARIGDFLEKHRQGSGEKRALHQRPLELTSMGRVFLSQAALESLPWGNL